MEILSESDIKKKMLMMFIVGVIIGLFWGYKGENPPHDVWLGENESIMVVQKPGSYIYHFGRNSDGSYDYVGTKAQPSPKK
jgi:hypothetical protein